MRSKTVNKFNNILKTWECVFIIFDCFLKYFFYIRPRPFGLKYAMHRI